MAYTARAEPLPEWQREELAVLTWDDLNVVMTMLAEIAPRWSAELNRGGPDEATIVVMPEGANDLIGPAFVLHRSRGGVQLDQFRWDEYRKLGGFRGLDDALKVLRARLVPLVTRRPADFESDE
jgi:hypothetical protein